jgi:hypothetical protein
MGSQVALRTVKANSNWSNTQPTDLVSNIVHLIGEEQPTSWDLNKKYTLSAARSKMERLVLKGSEIRHPLFSHGEDEQL